MSSESISEGSSGVSPVIGVVLIVAVVVAVTGLVLITQMGWLSIIGAGGIITAGVVVYFVYGRKRTNREGAVSSIRTGEDHSK